MKPFAIVLILIALISLVSPTFLARTLAQGANAGSGARVTNFKPLQLPNSTMTTASADSETTSSTASSNTTVANSSSNTTSASSTAVSTAVSSSSTSSSSESSNSTTTSTTATTISTMNTTQTTTLQTTTTLNQTSSTIIVSNSTSTHTTSTSNSTTTTTSQSTTQSATTNSTTTSNSTTTTTTPIVQVTIDSHPEGLGYVNVDGSTINTLHIFNWTVGSIHTLSASSAVSCGSGCQYSYQSWNDGGAQSHTIAVQNNATTYKATFHLQYYLTALSNPSDGGLVTPSSGWYDYGTQVPIQAYAFSGYTFASWSSGGYGSYNGNSPTAVISVTAPILEVANFQYVGTSGYSATFEEYNIPAGVTWGISVGSSFFTTTSTSITVYGLNGIMTYAYQNSVSSSDTRYVCQLNCSGSVSGYTTVTATYAVQPMVTPQTQQYGTPQILVAGQTLPSNIALDNAGDIYWTNQNSGQLLKLAEGSKSPVVLLTGLQDVLGVGVDRAGNIYYSEYLQGNIYRLSAGSSTPQLLKSTVDFPNSMSVDLNGNVYFITGRTCGDKIVKLNISSNTLTTILTASNGTDQAFGGLFIHPSGDLYYTTCNNYAINMLPAGSTAPQVVLNVPSQPSGIWVDNQRNIFYIIGGTVDTLPNGARTPFVLAEGLSLHQIALDSQGSIYYADAASGIVWEIPNLSASALSNSAVQALILAHANSFPGPRMNLQPSQHRT